MTPSSYFRFPHLHGDLVTFVAEDDVWIAPVGGGRAWRVSSLQLPARNPRFTPDGKRLVWTVVQGTAPEVVTADVDGGGYRQLSYFGHSSTRVKGFTPDGDVLVTSAFRQSDSRHTHAYSLPVDRRLGAGTPVRPGRIGGLSDPSSATNAPWCSPACSRVSLPGGSATAAARRASCGSTPTETVNSSGSPPDWTETSRTPCGSRAGSRSCPTTRATETSTPCCPTAATCGATRTTRTSMSATPPPTANG